jgi:hypothetical protein
MTMSESDDAQGPNPVQSARRSTYAQGVRKVLVILALIGSPVVFWGFRHGRETGLMVTVATCSVLFFGSLPIVIGATTRKKEARRDDRDRIVVKREP